MIQTTSDYKQLQTTSDFKQLQGTRVTKSQTMIKMPQL